MCVQHVLVHQHPSHDIYGHDPSMLSDFPSVCNLCSLSNPPNHNVCLCDLPVCHMWFKYVQTRIIVQFLQLWSTCAWSVYRVQFYSFPISLLWPYICMPGLPMKYESNQYIFEHWLHKYLWQLFMIRTKLITCIWCIDAGLQTHAPLLNSCQCAVPHVKTARSRVSREYLPSKTSVGIDFCMGTFFLPVPPHLQLINLLFFVRIFEQLQERVVEPFRVCNCIRTRENGWRHQGEADLEQSLVSKEMGEQQIIEPAWRYKLSRAE